MSLFSLKEKQKQKQHLHNIELFLPRESYLLWFFKKKGMDHLPLTFILFMLLLDFIFLEINLVSLIMLVVLKWFVTGIMICTLGNKEQAICIEKVINQKLCYCQSSDLK